MKYYKTKDGKGWLCDHVAHKDANYVEITKEEWDAHVAELEAHRHREPSQAQLKRREISKLKSELASTDWVIVKIAESTDAEEIASLREKYASVIAERKAKRARINELEGE